jgi:DNA-binding transcriptional LysR family regulator
LQFNYSISLNKRDADIALRMFRPTQPDIVARRLCDMEIGFYAIQDYINDHGTPNDFGELLEHNVIGFDRYQGFIEAASHLGYCFSSSDFCLRTDNLLLQIALARSGAGVVATHVALSPQWPELKRVLNKKPPIALPLWIACHSDTQYNQRIQALTKFLSNWFKSEQ